MPYVSAKGAYATVGEVSSIVMGRTGTAMQAQVFTRDQQIAKSACGELQDVRVEEQDEGKSERVCESAASREIEDERICSRL